MFDPSISPHPPVGSAFAMTAPNRRGADLDSMVSLNLQSLFPDIRESIYQEDQDTSLIEQAAEKALSKVDMTMIRPDHTVNVLCDEHGFVIQGGSPYAALIRKVKDLVEKKTGCRNIRLRFCCSISALEAKEIIPAFHLDALFDGKVKATGPFKKSVAIQTEIGTLQGLADVYDADWFIHTYYDDPREIYFHRFMNRTLKAFVMGYARYETRSVYHMNFGNRSSNIVPRAIFDSPFVQEKHGFTCTLTSSPAGITGVDADNDLYALDKRSTVNLLKSYGKMIRLFNAIDSCIMVLDGERWPWYIHGGGVNSGVLLKGPADYMDLNVGSIEDPIPKQPNPAVKALVVNYCYRSFFVELAEQYPTIIVGHKQMPSFKGSVKRHAVAAESLDSAVSIAKKMTGTDKVIVFDHSFGHINLTESMGELLMNKAPEVSKDVDQNRLPLWLSQRGIDPDAAI